MYEAFFKLKENPFALTPSHRFLYLSEGHKEAFALLKYGVVERKGFIMLTGDVGTGKTTIIQALLKNLSTDVECIHFSNPLLSPGEFIDYLASSTFKRRVHFRSKSDFLFEFEDYLKKAQQHQRAFILIIDEAQTLSLDLMEEIRLLSNLESSEEKLINIFLVGQPELIDRLKDPECRALYQRIASRFHLNPLNREETGRYIMNRLQVAGSRAPERIFSKQAIQALYAHTGGIPRTLNILADNALLLGYSRGSSKISREMIEESYRDMHAGEEDAAAAEPEVEIVPKPAPKAGERAERTPRLRKGFGWAFAAAVLLAALIHFSGITVFEILDTRDRNWAEAIPVPPWLKENFKMEGPSRTAGAAPSKPEPKAEPAVIPTPGTVDRTGSVAPEGPGLPPFAAGDARAEDPSWDLQVKKQHETPGGVTDGAERVTVKPGDYLTKLAMDVYGRADGDIFERIQKANPDLRDIHRIEVGQVIVFPSLSASPKERIYTVHVASYMPNRSAQDAFRALLDAGYEAFIVPFYSPEKGMLYRITIGNFQGEKEAEAYAAELAEKPGFTYANVLQVEMSR
ncbi:MAG: AAA family ATPase [Deltaproteobacteria bacterium]|nr:AAA family ATPase [Deltaproteobacteria bacterium]